MSEWWCWILAIFIEWRWDIENPTPKIKHEIFVLEKWCWILTIFIEARRYIENPTPFFIHTLKYLRAHFGVGFSYKIYFSNDRNR